MKGESGGRCDAPAKGYFLGIREYRLAHTALDPLYDDRNLRLRSFSEEML